MDERKLVRTISEFPGNSDRDKVTKPIVERKKIEPIVTGKVIKQQKTFGQKLSETFFGDDTRTVGDYILHDILIPAMKSTLSDMVGGGIEMLLFGERRSGKSSIYRDRDRSYVPYNRITRQDDRSRDSRSMSRTARSRQDFDEIILESRGEAEDVLSHMVDLIDDYGVVSVGDYYELVGIEASYTDNKYGWTNVRDAFVERVRNGYSIRLPRPREI
jgi:hypothetical protein